MKQAIYIIPAIIIAIVSNIAWQKEQLQGMAYNIIYLHVPLSWITLTLYLVLVGCSVMYIIYKNPSYQIIHNSVIQVTIITCALSIITGSLWAKPTWDTYMTVDIRIISMIVLLVTLIVISKLKQAQHIVTIIASVNIIIIKYVVRWYTSMHQQASVTLTESKIHISIMMPMLVTWIGLICLTIAIVVAYYKKEKYKR